MFHIIILHNDLTVKHGKSAVGKVVVTMLCSLGCKAVGLAALTFCIGMIAGLIFPIYIVAISEAVLIVFMAYLCLFKW